MTIKIIGGYEFFCFHFKDIKKQKLRFGNCSDGYTKYLSYGRKTYLIRKKK